MRKLLTIIVPIKDSYKYTYSIIEQVTSMNSELIDMVISDNSDDNSEMIQYIDNLGSSCINYFHHDKPISMTENFEVGIKEANGEYVCILGADDNFSTKILEVVQYLKDNDIESAIFNKAAYNWPGMQFRVHHKTPNLTIKKFTGELKHIDVSNEFNALLARGMTSLGKLPAPYHGVIRKERFEEVLLKSGRYIPGASPDMAMAVSLSLVTSKHVFIDAPITISGHSYNSAGGKGARGQHKGNLKNKSFLPADIEERWPSFIPKVWTSPTVYADSLVSSLKKMKEEDKLKSFQEKFAALEGALKKLKEIDG